MGVGFHFLKGSFGFKPPPSEFHGLDKTLLNPCLQNYLTKNVSPL